MGLRGMVAVASLVAGALLPAPAEATSAKRVRAKAVKWAVKHAGMREIGTTNCSPAIDRWERQMGLRVPPCRPWCGAYVHQAFLRAGVRLSARLIDPNRSYIDAVSRKRGLRSIPLTKIRKGDLVFFRFRANMHASHLAIARGRPRNGRVPTAEGNVAHRSLLTSRPLRTAVLAARVVVR